MKPVLIHPPGRPLSGRVELPGSKSITNRALLLAGLAEGTSRLTGALKSDDTRYMAKALWQMGVRIEEPDYTSYLVHGRGRLVRPERDIFVGNAGTAMRFLTAAAALVPGKVLLDGDAHMRQRPIGPLIEALAGLGVTAEAATGCPPVYVYGKGTVAGRAVIDASLSSQYASALLMVAACGTAPVEIALTNPDIGARGYVDLTLKVMRAFGAAAEETAPGVWTVQPTGYQPRDFAIEPDASAATYPWAWAAITGGAIDIGLAPEQFSQPDAAAYAHIAAFPKMAASIDGAQMQDAVPTLAVLAAYNETPVKFTGIANLRVKETDRIAVLAEGLNRLKPGLAKVKGDDLIVSGDPALRGAKLDAAIDPHADHRMAMAFTLAGLVSEGVTITDGQCVHKTWPTYYDTLTALGVQLTPL